MKKNIGSNYGLFQPIFERKLLGIVVKSLFSFEGRGVWTYMALVGDLLVLRISGGHKMEKIAERRWESRVRKLRQEYHIGKRWR